MSQIAHSAGPFEAEFPVLIVGAGAAGLIAALAAHEAGATPLVIERDPVPMGSTALSAGLIPAAGTRWQAEAGIADSPERFAADIMAKARNEPDPALVGLLCNQCGHVLEWLADAHGLAFSLLDDFRYPGHSASRMHALPSRSGRELVDALRSAAERAGIDLLCDARVTRLFTQDAKITGVEFTRPDGTLEQVGCQALVLACNGYGGNKALVAQHIPSLKDALYFGHPGNQGDALLWGEALGAKVRHLSGHQGHGSVAHPAGILITWATITEGGFQVNQEAERFSNEMSGYSEQAANVLRQPGAIAWTVFDARIAKIAEQFEDFRLALRSGAILTATEPEALAHAMHLPAQALANTFADVAALKAAAAVDRFGRNFSGSPALHPPFHAVRVTGALFHTQGGLVVDEFGRVLGHANQPLANVFAAGGAACGVSGSEASGYLSGNGLLSAVALGAVAGRGAAALSLLDART
jgi:fumarate reductase flavoprotein subunit